jgi:hypothetical protein
VLADASHRRAPKAGASSRSPTDHEVVEGYETLKKLRATRPPGASHDPLVLAKYPAAKPGLEGWVVRLDAEQARIAIGAK